MVSRWATLPRDESFRELDHPADVFLELRGRDLAELYLNGLFGLYAQVIELTGVRLEQIRPVHGSGDDPAGTLRSLLAEALYLFETERFVAGGAVIDHATEKSAGASLWGETFSPEKHERLLEVKAVTYHQLKAWRTESGEWRATLIFDV
ncbi:MAG: archease [Thermoleophilia bacterium]